MTNKSKFLTIFTPTYNRATLLPNLYESLKNSTNQNFIWLVIDDDSTDNTLDLLQKWKEDNLISIEYYHQNHGGKMAAFNLAVQKAHTDLFMTIDSDDTIDAKAVETIYENYQKDMSLFKSNVCAGYIAYNKPLGNTFEEFPTIEGKEFYSFFELKDTYRYRGESIWIRYLPRLQKTIIPFFANEMFLMDDIHHFIFSHTDNLKLLPQVLGYYEYQPSGLTNSNFNELIANSPKGYALYLLLYSHLMKDSLLRIRYIAKYLGVCAANNIDPKTISSLDCLKNIPSKITPLDIFLGKLYSLHYKNKYQNINKQFKK